MSFILDTLNKLNLTASNGPTSGSGDLSNPQFWLVDFFTGRKTLSGQRITPNTALTFSAFFAAVRSISEDIAKLPVNVFRANDDFTERTNLTNHPVWSLFNIAPNDEMTPIVFRETMIQWALGWGGGFAEIERNGRGDPVNLWPIHPSRVVIIRDPQDKIYYRVRGNYSADLLVQSQPFDEVDLPAEDVFHFHGLGPMGNTGYSIIRLAAESMGVALAAQSFGAAFFGNGTAVSGILSHPQTLTDTAWRHLRESWQQQYQGPFNANKPAILEEGTTWTPISVPPEEAQFLETRQFQVEEIARWFRMPPHKLQQLLRATFSNIESQNIEYADDCLSPWCTRWNQETKRKLITGSNSRLVFCQHDLRHLKQGDMAARTAYYKAMANIGAINPDEVRHAEGMNPIADGSGKKYMVQINMTTLDKVGEDQQVGPDGKPLKPAQGKVVDDSADDKEKELKAIADGIKAKRFSAPITNGVNHVKEEN